MGLLQVYYDFLNISLICPRLAGQIKKLQGPPMAPGPQYYDLTLNSSPSVPEGTSSIDCSIETLESSGQTDRKLR